MALRARNKVRAAERGDNVSNITPPGESAAPGSIMLIPCDDCGHMISVRAEFCSNCGARGNVPRLILPENKTGTPMLSLASLARKFGLRKNT
jgi:hypothetical protein